MKQDHSASAVSGKVDAKPSYDQVTISSQAAAMLRIRRTAQQTESLSKAANEPNTTIKHDQNSKQ